MPEVVEKMLSGAQEHWVETMAATIRETTGEEFAGRDFYACRSARQKVCDEAAEALFGVNTRGLGSPELTEMGRLWALALTQAEEA